jgi:phosphomannomutase
LSVKEVFDFCFAENGLEAYRLGQPLASTSFLEWIGEEKYQKLAKWILRYISDLEGLPAMRGTFIEFRNGMINVSPVGRNASTAERNEFEAWDKKNNCRPKMIQALKEAFPDLAVT